MELKFTDQVVLITGGSSGIGLAVAQLMLEGGAKVLIVGKNAEKGKAALDTLGRDKEYLEFFQADLSKVEDCRSSVNKVVELFGKLDVVINSAGIYKTNPIENVEEAEFDRIIDTNLKGTFFVCKYAIPVLRKSKGTIVNVSSDSGLKGNPLETVYCASKGAVTIFTKALAVDLASENIRVNCVCPGDIKTPMLDREMAQSDNPEKYLQEISKLYPVGRIGYPEEVASVICFLASNASPFTTGAAWSVDGGIT
ncbi:SDR family oxidoreductase [bacterium]|nr:SDR family oxidoreductase [bacterium]